MKTLSASILALTGFLACVSMQAAADYGVGGDETNNDRNVPFANMWTVLTAEPFQTWTNDTQCVATGSADAENPGGGLYRFVLSVDNAAPPVDSACERSVAFDNGAVQSVEEVSSTCTFRHLAAGFHRIYWLARRANAAAPALTVRDNSMTFVCMERLLDLDGEGDGGPD
jgi:hypothetical protein